MKDESIQQTSRCTLGLKPILPANTCDICGKRLGNRRAYAGHMQLAHGKRVGIMAELDEKIAEMSRVRDALYALTLWQGQGWDKDVLKILRGEVHLKQEHRDALDGHK